jgi:cell division protein ZapA
MSELTISVTIADRPYRLTIKRNEEEQIRKAATIINEKLKNYSASYAFNDKQDLLAMVALEEAISLLSAQDTLTKTDSSVVQELKEIDTLLTENLKTR